MNTHHVAALVSGLLLMRPAVADGATPLDPASGTILDIRLSAAVLATFGEQGGRFAPPFPRVEALERFAPTLEADLRKPLALRDGWGRPLSVLFADAETVVLISFGADGVPDRDYVALWESGDSRGDGEALDPSSPNCDIVFLNGEFARRPEPPRSAATRVLSDLRSIGTAIESFAVDNDVYPGPTGGLRTIDALVDDLEPIYIRTLPRLDPWGHPYLVSSDGKAYVVVSAGADGALELAYDEPSTIAPEPREMIVTTDDDADIVFVNGQFVRSPADSRKRGSGRGAVMPE